MKKRSIPLLLSLGIAAVLFAGCRDGTSLTSPGDMTSTVPELRFTRLDAGAGDQAVAIKWRQVPEGVQETKVIGPAGGIIQLSGADLRLVFPVGAVSSPTTITVKLVKGDYVAYDMLPHGLTFNLPVLAYQGLGNTEARNQSMDFLSRMGGVYVPDESTPDYLGLVSILDALPSVTIFKLERLRLVPDYQIWQLSHFSRYMLASGMK